MEQTVVDLFRDSAYRYPAETALQFYKRPMTYGELDVVSVQFAKFLITHGLRAGDRVVMILPNCPQFVIAYLGILRAGGVVAALNPLLKADEQLIDRIIRSYHSGIPIDNIAEKLIMEKKEVQKIIDNWHNSVRGR